jgi:tetratricopeptide (TPR) repeat protein
VRVLVTSNAPDWSGIAEPVEIEVWPREIGADYLVARTRRVGERAEAEALSRALGGLPLAHEQAAAYCGRMGISLGDYRKRFEAAPARLLDIEIDAPIRYRLTAVKAFALAIDEATKVHPAAEALIVHASLLAPEPIPLFLFSEGRQKFGEPLASQLADDGLDEAVAALRAFALVDRETIADERDPTIVTETIRLHRLVRAVAARRAQGEAHETARRALIEAMTAVYPSTVFNDPSAWQHARRLDALAVDLVASPDLPPTGKEEEAGYLLDRLASYRQGALAAYVEARRLFDRALAIREKALGPEHPLTATSLNNLALLLQAQGDLAGAQPLYERALAIREKVLGREHLHIASTLSNLAVALRAQGDLAGARPLHERALAIREKALGPEHPHTAISLNNIGLLLYTQGDFAGARPLFERGLAIHEKAFGREHPNTALSLHNIALPLHAQGDLAGARPLYERALAIREKALGPLHPDTNLTRGNLASLRLAERAPSEALLLSEAALAAHEKVLGTDHPWTKDSAAVAAAALDALGRAGEAAALRARYGLRGGPAAGG